MKKTTGYIIILLISVISLYGFFEIPTLKSYNPFKMSGLELLLILFILFICNFLIELAFKLIDVKRF